MKAITYSYARQNLSSVFDECCENHEPVLITRERNKDKEIVLLSRDDFESWKETIYIMENYDMERLRESIAQANAGQAKPRQLIHD